MRLAGQIKAGFYPTPVIVTSMIRSWLRFPNAPFCALDPCAGEGVALAQTVAQTQGVTYGVELDTERSRAARQRLDHVLTGDYRTVRASIAAFSLLWCNPPYDNETTADNGQVERKEHTFLRDTIHYLVAGGTLVYIIPQNRLAPETARMLAYRFEALRAFRFPDEEYGTFNQCVVLGTRRRHGAQDPEAAEALLRFAHRGGGAEALTTRPSGEPSYAIPPGDPVKIFAGGVIDPETLLDELPGSRLWARARELTGITYTQAAGQPPVLLHRGHLALLLAAGEIDGPLGTGTSRHVVRGIVQKHVTVTEEEDDKGGITRRETESLQILVRTVDTGGTIRALE